MDHINHSGLFYWNSLPAISHFFCRYTKIVIKANTDFSIEGDNQQNVYFLVKGVAGLSYKNKHGTKTFIILAENSLIKDIILLCAYGDIELMSAYRAFQVVGHSYTDLEIWTMPYEDFSYLLDHDEQFFLEVSQCIYQKTDQLIHQLSILRFSNAETKIKGYIGDLEKLKQIERSMIPKKLLAQKKIAELLAIHRVTVAKTIKKLRNT